MPDTQTRELERRFRASGSPGDLWAWARARLKTGETAPLDLGGDYALDAATPAILHRGDVLKHADPRSFEVLDADAGWARDRKRVFRFGVHCRGLNAPTLRVISPLFATDEARVTTLSGFAIRDADPGSFEPLGESERMSYARDASRVYFFELGFRPRVLKLARETFRVLGGPFATDGEAVYYEGYRTRGSLEGFERLGDRLWRDATHLYRGRTRQGAAPR